MNENTETDIEGTDQYGLNNQMIIDQINKNLQSGFVQSLAEKHYCVMRSETSGVLAVVAASGASDDKAIVFGPKPFSHCIKYVNASLIRK